MDRTDAKRTPFGQTNPFSDRALLVIDPEQVIFLPHGHVIQLVTQQSAVATAEWMSPKQLKFFRQGIATAQTSTQSSALTAGVLLGTRTHVVMLGLTRGTLLSQAAASSGMMLAEKAPIDLLLLLALITHMSRLPHASQFESASTLSVLLSQFLAAYPSSTAVGQPDSDLKAQIRQTLLSGSSGLVLPTHRWDLARYLVLLGTQAWRMRGADAYWWGTLGTVPSAVDNVILAVAAATVFDAKIAGTLPYTVANSPGRLLLPELLPMLSGPDLLPPALIPTHGIGGADDPDHPLTVNAKHSDPISLTTEQCQLLTACAIQNLTQIDRRLPRLLGQMLTMPLPTDLLPDLAAWHIAQLVVQVHPEGLFVGICDSPDTIFVSTWWPASPTAGDRVPLSVPPGVWPLVHNTLAALWHDLLADAIVVESAGPGDSTTAQKNSPPRRQLGTSTVQLPPLRYKRPAQAQWVSAEDTATIRRACQIGPTHRHLPPGTQARDAELRATASGYPAPPPGYTFVRGYTRGGRGDTTTPAPVRQVRAQGLFRLALVLRTLVKSK